MLGVRYIEVGVYDLVYNNIVMCGYNVLLGICVCVSIDVVREM